MSAADNKQLMIRWFEEVWNQRRAAVIDELMAEDIVIHGHNPEMRGREGFKELHTTFCAALPDMRITPEIVICEGDLVVALNKVEGTHTGELLGIQPRHRRVTFSGVSIGRVKDGKFVEAWDHYNFLELYGQLDALEHISALRKSASM
jgi:predicted ester cyclase